MPSGLKTNLSSSSIPNSFNRARLQYQLGNNAGYKSDLNASYPLLNEQRKRGRLTEKEEGILSTIQKQLEDPTINL
jgi:hypothetical protein